MEKLEVGIGFTNACNYDCSHCYSRGNGEKFMALERFKHLCDNVDINSVNFGTGESFLHPDFQEAVRYATDKGIRVSVTSNGYTIKMLDDEHLKLFNDIDLSLDFSEPDLHDSLRGDGAASEVLAGVERCKKLGVEISLATAMMKENCRQIDQLTALARSLDVNLRINTYKPVNTFKHKMTYEEFWEGIRRLLGTSSLISCSEPIVNARIGNKTLDGGSPCGKVSLRINPDGGVVPCVYWKESRATIEDLVDMRKSSSDENFTTYVRELSEETRIIPTQCNDCKHLDACKGGCASARYYNDLTQPDPYCFIQRNDLPELTWSWAPSKSLVHSSYLCTIIVK